MHGLGNDYVYISLFDQHVDEPAALARAISARHRGVGSDGLILVTPPEERDAHVRMIVYNADGSRAEVCGNGLRCVAKLAYEHRLTRANPLRVQTDRGVLSLDLALDAEGRVTEVRADLGVPILEPRRIPVALEGDRVVSKPIAVEGHTLLMTCVSLGNPHAVFFEPELSRVPLKEWGPQLECHPLFPERINVHFVQVVRRDFVGMLTWERGSGITRACGSGASAVCVAGVLNNLTDRAIAARLPGGQLELEWDQASNHVFMTGPAEEVFTGVWAPG
ncbi:MAG: diaminopimelate epimerase [Phycisphaerae bacterium]|nr:diaminopimelate epimerase [Phycisphaerae bacterium]